MRVRSRGAHQATRPYAHSLAISLSEESEAKQR